MTQIHKCVALVFFCGLISVHSIVAQESEIETAAQQLATRIAGKGGKTVAVADFTDLQGRVTELGRYLAEELSVALVNSDAELRVIDRGHIRTLLAEHELAEQGIIDPDSASELGRIAGVDVLIAGTVTDLGEAARLSVKALRTESAMILAGQSITIPTSSAMAGLIRRDILAGPAVGDEPRTSSSPNVQAFQNDFLIATVESAAVSEDVSRATLAIVLENKTSTDHYIGCTRAALLDDRAGDWKLESMTGVKKISESSGRTAFGSSGRSGSSGDHREYTRLSPGAKSTLALEFSFFSFWGEDRGRPARLSLSVDCVRRSGGRNTRFTIGLPSIPVS